MDKAIKGPRKMYTEMETAILYRVQGSRCLVRNGGNWKGHGSYHCLGFRVYAA